MEYEEIKDFYTKKIVWPKTDKDGKRTKDGSIDGVSFTDIWEGCKKEANKYAKNNFPELEKTEKAEKVEIKALWDKMSKEDKNKVENTKGNYIG